MLTNTDYVQISIIYILDGSAIVLNAILVYAIVFKTPKFMRPYSIFLLNNAMVDICSATASALAIIRVVNSHNSEMIFVSLGPCSVIGHWFCHLCHCVHLTLSTQAIVILFLSFGYRLLIISETASSSEFKPSNAAIWSTCVLSFLPSVIAVYCFYSLGEEPPSHIRQQLRIEEYVTMWLPHLRDIRALGPLIYYVLSAPVVITAIFFVRRRLLSAIATVEINARVHHKRIAQALTYQMLLPSGLGLGCAIWLIDLMEVSYGEWSQRSVMGIASLFSLASPLINLFYLPPYRGLLSASHQSQVVSVMSLA